jgi:hypothetical protein
LFGDHSDHVEQTWAIDVPTSPAEVQISIAQGQWAVLEVSGHQLHRESGVIDLSKVISASGAPVLARASDSATSLLIAHRDGLISVDLATGSFRELVINRQGAPATPVDVAGCSYAAWSDGLAWRRCGETITELALNQVAAVADLGFILHDDHVVLNNCAAGASWAVQADGRLIDNWDDLIRDEEDEREQQLDQLDMPPKLERTQLTRRQMRRLRTCGGEA